MKVALISFGHSENALPLAKELSSHVDIDLYFCFALNWRTQGVLNFDNAEGDTGLLSQEATGELLGPEIIDYIGGRFGIHLFIYQDLKFRTWRNWLLSYQFSRILQNTDIIHFNGQNGVLPQLMLFLNHTPQVFTIHDFNEHSGESGYGFSDYLNRFLVYSKNQVILQNKADYLRLRKSYPDRASTINYVPFGPFDIYREYTSAKLNGAYSSDILFLGRISEYKGIEYLVEAVNRVRKELPNVRLTLAGSGKYYFDVSGLDHDPNTRILNRYISNQELAQLMQHTKVVVCPYVDATQSGVVMTAYAFGKPVIATTVGGLPEVVEEGVTGRLVPPKDARALAAAIEEMLTDPDSLEEMGGMIQHRFSFGAFSWQRIAAATADVYQKALGTAPSFFNKTQATVGD